MRAAGGDQGAAVAHRQALAIGAFHQARHAGREGAAAGADVGGRQRAILRIIVEPDISICSLSIQMPTGGMQQLVKLLLLARAPRPRSSPGSAATAGQHLQLLRVAAVRRHAGLHRRAETHGFGAVALRGEDQLADGRREFQPGAANRRPAPAPASPAAAEADSSAPRTEKNWPWWSSVSTFAPIDEQRRWRGRLSEHRLASRPTAPLQISTNSLARS